MSHKSSPKTQQKRRGRPPKTEVKPKQVIFEQPKETEELVLYLPITDKQNDFTFNETETSAKLVTTQNEDDIIDAEIEDEIVSTTDNDINDINKLVNEIKKRDIIIKNLKDNLKNFKNYQQDNFISVNKDVKKKLINLGLITFNDNKLHITETTNIACWWCCYNFSTYPIFLPEKYQDGKYHVFGNFCSFSCALAYNDNLNDYRKGIREGLVKKMYKDIFNIDCQIKSAPAREVLEKFGGPLSIDNFRDPKFVCSKNLKITIPPQIPLLSYYEEINIKT